MNVRTNSVKAWVLAARPKTLSAALIPVMVAAALASHAPQCSWAAIVICALFAALMQIAANLINDLLDFRKGTDGTDRLGPERACAQGWITPRAMGIGIAVVLALALICGSLVLSLSPALPSWEGSLPLEGGFEGGWIMVALGATCVLFAFLYNLRPIKLFTLLNCFNDCVYKFLITKLNLWCEIFESTTSHYGWCFTGI